MVVNDSGSNVFSLTSPRGKILALHSSYKPLSLEIRRLCLGLESLVPQGADPGFLKVLGL